MLKRYPFTILISLDRSESIIKFAVAILIQ